MTYRLLPAEEWERLGPIMERQNFPIPDSRVAAAAVAERDGEIVGVWFLQMILHLEPLVIEDPYVNFRTLQETLETPMLLDKKGITYYCCTENEKTTQIAKVCGFNRRGDLWEKEI